MRAISLSGDAIQPGSEPEPVPPPPSVPPQQAWPWLCSGVAVAGEIPPYEVFDGGAIAVTTSIGANAEGDSVWSVVTIEGQ